MLGIIGIIPGASGFKGLTSIARVKELYRAGGLKAISKAALAGSKELLSKLADTLRNLGTGLVSTVKKFPGVTNLTDLKAIFGRGGQGTRGVDETTPLLDGGGPHGVTGATDDVLTRFLGGGAVPLNKYLRNPGSYSAAERAAFDADAAALSLRLKDLPDAGSIKTWRGVEGDLVADLGLRMEGPFVDPGFLSTSTSIKTAEEFIATGGKMTGFNESGIGTLLVVQGQGGRNMRGLTGLDEAEILYDKGTTFTVGGISQHFQELVVNGQTIKYRTVYLDYEEPFDAVTP